MWWGRRLMACFPCQIRWKHAHTHKKHRFHWVKDVWPIKCIWQTLWEMSKIFVSHTTSLSRRLKLCYEAFYSIYQYENTWNATYTSILKCFLAEKRRATLTASPFGGCEMFCDCDVYPYNFLSFTLYNSSVIPVIFLRLPCPPPSSVGFQVNMSICRQREIKAEEIQIYREWNWIMLWTIPFLAFCLMLSYCRCWEHS